MASTMHVHCFHDDGSTTIEFFTLALEKMKDGRQVMRVSASRGNLYRIDREIPCTPGISVQHAINEAISIITKRLVEDFTGTGQVG